MLGHVAQSIGGALPGLGASAGIDFSRYTLISSIDFTVGGSGTIVLPSLTELVMFLLHGAGGYSYSASQPNNSGGGGGAGVLHFARLPAGLSIPYTVGDREAPTSAATRITLPDIELIADAGQAAVSMQGGRGGLASLSVGMLKADGGRGSTTNTQGARSGIAGGKAQTEAIPNGVEKFGGGAGLLGGDSSNGSQFVPLRGAGGGSSPPAHGDIQAIFFRAAP